MATLELVEVSLKPGASVAAIAQEHGINTNLLFNWRRLRLRAEAPAVEPAKPPPLLPITVQMDAVPKVPKAVAPRPSIGVIEMTSAPTCSTARSGRRGQRALRAALVGRHRVIGLPSNTCVWIVAGHTDVRKGFDGLTAMVQTALAANLFCGHVLVFRGKRGDILRVLWFDGQGLMLLAKRLERGPFV